VVDPEAEHHDRRGTRTNTVSSRAHRTTTDGNPSNPYMPLSNISKPTPSLARQQDDSLGSGVDFEPRRRLPHSKSPDAVALPRQTDC